MKTLSTKPFISMLVAAQLVLVAGPAAAQRWSPWTEATPVDEVNTAFAEGCPFEAPDGLSLFIASNRPGTRGGMDIWAADRDRRGGPFMTPQNLGEPVNSAANDYCPTPLHDSWLFFVSEREGPDTCEAGPGSGDIYLIRENPASGWGEPLHLGCVEDGTGPNSTGAEFSPSFVETSAGTFLYFSSDVAGNQDIYRSRLEPDGIFGPPILVAELSTEFDDRMPNVSKNGLEIVFSSTRPGGFGSQDVWYASRSRVDEPWSPPVDLGTAVNTAGSETRASFSWDRRRVYFGRDGDIYVTTRSKLRGGRER